MPKIKLTSKSDLIKSGIKFEKSFNEKCWNEIYDEEILKICFHKEYDFEKDKCLTCGKEHPELPVIYSLRRFNKPNK